MDFEGDYRLGEDAPATRSALGNTLPHCPTRRTSGQRRLEVWSMVVRLIFPGMGAV
jgi:hypothetical protein